MVRIPSVCRIGIAALAASLLVGGAQAQQRGRAHSITFQVGDQQSYVAQYRAAANGPLQLVEISSAGQVFRPAGGAFNQVQANAAVQQLQPAAARNPLVGFAESDVVAAMHLIDPFDIMQSPGLRITAVGLLTKDPLHNYIPRQYDVRIDATATILRPPVFWTFLP